jgi:hypothetical protein
MLWNGAEYFSGVLVFQDAIQAPEAESRKQFYNKASHLPGNLPITAHAAWKSIAIRRRSRARRYPIYPFLI